MHNILLDTGALVAMLDKSEKNHQKCVGFLKNFTGKLLTTESVLTEALYLLGPFIRNQKTCIDFILKGGAILISQSLDSLSRCVALMEKYSDVPMDFADATLVALAEEIETNEIFTLDKKGFFTYRLKGKKTFRVYPE